jgi:hypothetical protein
MTISAALPVHLRVRYRRFGYRSARGVCEFMTLTGTRAHSFDHFIRNGEPAKLNCQSEHLRSVEVYDEFEFPVIPRWAYCAAERVTADIKAFANRHGNHNTGAHYSFCVDHGIIQWYRGHG